MIRKKILLADDHRLVRAGLRMIIEQTADFEVAVEVGDGLEAVRAARQLQPDIALVDLTMPRMNGLEAIAQIARMTPRIRVIALSMHTTEHHVVEALKAGAVGYVVKDAAAEELETALRAVSSDQSWLSPQVSDTVLSRLVRHARGEEDNTVSAEGEPLTARQREVLQLVAEGHSTREIADLLHISVKTVETHRAELMRRLDIHDIAGLTRYAIRHGIVTPER